MQIIIQVTADLARAVRARTPEARFLLDVSDVLRCPLRPLHPSEKDPPLGTYFTGDLHEDQVDAALTRFQAVSGVTAAYAKPKDALA